MEEYKGGEGEEALSHAAADNVGVPELAQRDGLAESGLDLCGAQGVERHALDDAPLTRRLVTCQECLTEDAGAARTAERGMERSGRWPAIGGQWVTGSAPAAEYAHRLVAPGHRAREGRGRESTPRKSTSCRRHADASTILYF